MNALTRLINAILDGRLRIEATHGSSTATYRIIIDNDTTRD